MPLRTAIFKVDEPSRVGEVRRYASELSRAAGLDTQRAGAVAVIVTEVATNLLKHAGGGEIQLRLTSDLPAAVEAVAIDRGPGMANADACIEDGYSTSGSAGTGLGAIRRLASDFDLYSQPNKGTVLVARISAATASAKGRIGVVRAPARGESVCGDTYGIAQRSSGHTIMVVDGLGHGVPAAQAADVALDVFQNSPGLLPDALLDKLHVALRPTRGAAAAVAHIDDEAGQILYAGVGNISGIIVAGEDRRQMVSHNGTVGHQLRRIQTFTYPCPRNATVVMHSDGLGTHWTVESYPGVLLQDPAVLAGVLYRDHLRGRDDVTVLVRRSPA